MSEINLLLGSLSNDLMRVASLIQRGSEKGAEKFYEQAQRWLVQLDGMNVKPYIQKIITDLLINKQSLDLVTADRFLMYGILLQNYSLHEKS